DQEHAGSATPGIDLIVPGFMKEIVAEITHAARRSPDVSQRSGVSVRMTVANYENLLANALKRAIRLGERETAPRISDLQALHASTTGKIELDGVGDMREDQVVDRLFNQAVLATFNRHLSVGEFERLIQGFDNGLIVDASALAPTMSYVHQVSHMDGVSEAVQRLGVGGSPAAIASAVEFILEGLHLHRKLNKDIRGGGANYRR
ncbi:MAG: magnesium chelatase, partial [Chloroflexota bacterium]